jgi:ferredoxin/flavodoxin---NADP+ reductase
MDDRAYTQPAMAVPADKFLTATITSRREISADLWAIRVDTGTRFPFTAGQYATLGLAGADGLIERAYSIASSPYEPELEFFIELVPAGALTPLLYRLHVGDTLSVRKAAKGRFLMDVATGPAEAPGAESRAALARRSAQREGGSPESRTLKDHLFLCTVTGVAPFVSLVRTLAQDERAGKLQGDRQLFLIQGASQSSELGYHDELVQLARDLPWLTYVPTVSRPWDDPGWSGEVGRVDDVIRKYADQWFADPTQGMAHLCGHPSMIEHGKAILARRGWPKKSLKEESYFVLPHHAE